MFHRESGYYKTTYAADMALYPLPIARWTVAGIALAMCIAPFFLHEYYISIINLVLVATVGALGLNILVGYTGQISIGHAAFMSVGAYTAANLAVRLDLPFWITLPAGGLMAAGVGAIVGIPSLRIKGLYLAIATLAAQYLFLFAAQHWESVTGGDRGLPVTPATFFGLRLDSDVRLYWLIMPITILMCVAAHNLFRTRIGRSFIAVRERDYSAEVLGIDLLRTKLLAFAIASFYGGIAGALMAYFFKVVNPEQYTFTASIFQLTAIIVGGLGSVLGSILGALFMVAVPEVLKAVVSAMAGADAAKSAIMLASARELVFGLLIVGFLLFEPFGLAEIVRRTRVALKMWPFRT